MISANFYLITFRANGPMANTGADQETLLTGGGLSYVAIFLMIDGTNCSPKPALECRLVNLVFISFSA